MNTLNESELKKDDINKDDDLLSSTYFSPKYLTSSTLLRLQLKDPTLRIQYLTQILIALQFIEVTIIKEKSLSVKNKIEEAFKKFHKRADNLIKKCPKISFLYNINIFLIIIWRYIF